MGNRFSCAWPWGSRGQSDESDKNGSAGTGPTFDVNVALVPLSPNVALGRVNPQIPQCLLLPSWFLQLQQELPAHLQRRKLELVFASWEHGFSSAQLKQRISERMSRRSDTQDLLLLIRPSVAAAESDASSSAGETPNTNGSPGSAPSSSQASLPVDRAILGAFLPAGLDFSVKKYFGTDGTFVFTSMVRDDTATGAPTVSPGLFHPSPTSSNPRAYGTLQQQKENRGGSSPSSASPTAEGGFLPPPSLIVSRCSVPKANDYFTRCANDGSFLFVVGGGGKGAAISVDAEFEYVSSSSMCPTFGNGCRCLLPMYPSAANQASSQDISGVIVEGCVARSPIHSIEVWSFSNTIFPCP